MQQDVGYRHDMIGSPWRTEAAATGSRDVESGGRNPCLPHRQFTVDFMRLEEVAPATAMEASAESARIAARAGRRT